MNLYVNQYMQTIGNEPVLKQKNVFRYIDDALTK